MTLNRLFAFSAIVVLLACSCTPDSRPSDVKSSVSSIRKYVDSFKGLSMEAARSRLAHAQFSEEEWKEGAFGGKQLVATFPEYEVRVLFSGDKVVTASFQILSE